MGTLYLKKYVSYASYWYNNYEIRIKSNGTKCAMTNGTSVRGFRGCAAVTWSSGNIIEPAADIDLGIEFPNEYGKYRDPAHENVMPDNISFECVDHQLRNLFVGPVFPGANLGIWVRETIVDGTQARQNIEGDISFEWY
jgi:hypothetical protein